MFAKGSILLILVPIILALIFIVVLVIPLLVLLLVITLFFIIFFRDPERKAGEGIVSPADGYISEIHEGTDNIRISIVMGIQNVHVNRAPLEGKVLRIEHKPGGHRPAFKKDSGANERLITEIETNHGTIGVIQIAGAFARRIVTYIKEGDIVSKGQRIGMIRFGSRVDLILPNKQVKVNAAVGSKVKAAASSLAQVSENED